jgi:DNA helicase HerA-like ATPase
VPQSKITLGGVRDPKTLATAGESSILLSMANRHGLITGATGTGKTVTLRVLAEGFARAGVPVFMADVKGDLAGLAYPGTETEKTSARLKALNITGFEGAAVPALFWDVFGKAGHPLRSTITDLGPVMLTRLFDLNPVQEGVLNIAFKFADEQSLPLLDLKDLSALIAWVGEHASELSPKYGNIAPASIGAIQRAILTLERSGGDKFFGEPALHISDIMQRDFSGLGVVSILDATTLINDPRVYSTMLLWLLSELFEELPEVGDLDKPKLVFFFDEAHLLFSNAPTSLLAQIEQVVRLVRSKGVGVYFVTQNPLDVPDSVAGQLGNRVQHALRAFTPRDQKAVAAAGDTLRPNPGFNAADVIPNLEVGEALVSCLDEKGSPIPVERVYVAPPRSRLGPISPEERAEVIGRSPLRQRYETAVDRESAFELLAKRTAQEDSAAATSSGAGRLFGAILDGLTGRRASRAKGASAQQGAMEALVGTTARTLGTELKRQLVRGILGSLKRSL